jgi:type VI secretion system secreted protein Hcp
MVQKVYLKLKMNRTNIEGECSLKSYDREGTIECLSFRTEYAHPETSIPDLTQYKTSIVRLHPVVVRKYIDKSTPRFIQALKDRWQVDEAKFMFFRPNPALRGGEEPFYTLRLIDASIVQISQVSDVGISVEEDAPQVMEDISLWYSTALAKYEPTQDEYYFSS